MKQDQSAILWRPEFAGLALRHKRYPGRLVIRSIAVGAIITLTAAQAADAPNVGEPASQAALIQKPAYTPQGYQMERYKAFARQTEMPVIAVTDKTTLEVGGELKTDIAKLAQLSTPQRAGRAVQCGVPPGVIDQLVQRFSSAPQPGADQFVRELRTAVIDYRFLQGEWGRY